MYGWVYNTERVFNWENRSNKPLNNRMMRNATLTLPPDFIPGNYKIEFFDTLSGKIIHQKISYLSNSLTMIAYQVSGLPLLLPRKHPLHNRRH